MLFGRLFAIMFLLISSSVFGAGSQDTRSAELTHYDKELNQVYNRLLGNLGDEEKTYLKEAQRAWIKTRDNDCKWAFVDKRDCLIDRTVNRTEELMGSLFQNKDGKYMRLEK